MVLILSKQIPSIIILIIFYQNCILYDEVLVLVIKNLILCLNDVHQAYIVK